MTSDEFSKGAVTEKRVVAQLMDTLIKDYGYSSDEMMIEAPIPGKRKMRADLVVYKSAEKIAPFIVFEIKRRILYPTMERDLLFHFRDTGVEYVVLADERERICYRFVDSEALEIPDIPKKGEEIGQISMEELKPAKNLAHKFWKITDMMRARGLKVENYVEEVNKLILCKIIDEQENKQQLKFMLTSDEVKNLDNASFKRSISNRIGSLFRRVKGKYPDLFQIDEEILLDPITLGRAISELQSYSFTQSSPDEIGAFYEEFISRSMKGSSAEFFTPRQIVDFIVRLVNPHEEDTILDPACGSGGFILKAMAHVWGKTEQSRQSPSDAEKAKQDYARNRLFGIDVNQKMVFTSKMNFLLRGDGHSNIFLGNSLIDSEVPTKVKRIIEARDGFDIVISNPPMGELVPRDEFSGKYMLVEGKRRQQIESLFLQRCLHFLKPGGRMALVVPERVLFSGSLAHLRRFLLENGYLRAIISLPVEAFFRYGTTLKTSILLIEKAPIEQPENAFIFMADLQVDKDSKKAEVSLSDNLDRVLMRYQDFKNGRHPVASWAPTTFILSSEELGVMWTVGRYDPMHMEIILSEYAFDESLHPRVPKRSLESISGITKGALVRSHHYVDQPIAEGIPYIRIGDMQKGTIVKSSLKYVPTSKVGDLSKAIVQPGDILFSTRGTIGKVAIVPEIMPKAIAASQIAILKANGRIINPEYLHIILESALVKRQVEPLIIGSIIRYFSIRDLRRLKVPVPPLSRQSEIVKKIEHFRNREMQLNTEKEIIRRKIEEILLGEDL